MKKIKWTFNRDFFEYLIHMAVFGAAFMVIGFYAPKIYTHYFDKTEYYKVKLPVRVERKEYHACDFVDVYFEREALIPIKGASVIALTLVNEQGIRERLHTEERQVVAEPGKSTVITHWTIPCDIKHFGTARYEGVLRYAIDGTFRLYPFYTENFIISTSEASLK